jgi:hypothetical protein
MAEGWLEHSGITEGAVFRRLIGKAQIGGSLNPGSIAPIFNWVAKWVRMPARFVAEVSGHSTRVGATQDLVELDIDLAAITQAGGWKSMRLPLRYAEKINAARAGMARAAVFSAARLNYINRKRRGKSDTSRLGATNDGYVVSIRQWTGQLGARISGRREEAETGPSLETHGRG